MKLFNKHITISLLLAAVVFTACEKADKLPFFETGSAPVLAASKTTVASTAADSNLVAIVFNWSNPKFAQDPSLYKFVIELDSTNRNFQKAASFTVTAKDTFKITGKELNSILLGWGFEFNKAYDVDVRVIASYGNNNDRKFSNTLKIRMTPYKIPPKVALPGSGRLFIVGGATTGGWTNPVPVPSQEFARLNETTFGGVFQLTAGEKYLLLPENGAWGKYGVDVAAGDNLSGSFKAEGGDIPAPAANGYYKMTIDFQKGVYNLEAITLQHGLPTDLFIVGGATPGGWNNPVPLPSQQLTRRNSVWFDVTLNFTTGEKFLILPTNGSWDKKFGADVAAPDGKSGTFKAEGADIPTPAASGSYKFTIDFYSGKYTLQ
ncbi:SusE domain-containing protein [Lacibacter sp.]|uniref:SusE domain-containing protein n=1 Tax=Lacibacter sp. TaxID=1915409 RepID=UPI002B4AB609|nr:SusE domain-containing protein [Lacibacter sp.]HLP36205.1 SusE domain-containing protein [Lacibacter sp.]